MAKTIMIQGTMSNAGKSLLAAGLCRVLKQDGYRVAPFKSQNMALNSFITKDGGEMGRAQVVQAEAAGIEPDVRMNPILLKPTTDVGSHVIVNGRVQGNMPAMEYYRRKRDFIPAVMEAYESLAREYDIIVIEGAGSPAEINLQENDIVMLDSSTTCLALAEAMIRSQKMLTVITNSLQICLLCNESNISFLVERGKSAALIPLFQWRSLNDVQQLQFHCIWLQLSQLASVVQHLFDGFCWQSIDEMHTGANPTGF